MTMKRIMGFTLIALILVGTLSCSRSGGTAKARTYSAWIGEGTWLTNIMDLGFKDPVAQEITKQTGVTLELSAARTDNPTEELNVMLAANELPDIVAITGPISTKLITGKYVIPYDDLIAKYGPNLKKNLGHVFDYWRYDDGKIYRVRGWVWNDPRYSLSMDVNTLYLRYDILKEMGFQKLDRSTKGNSIITLSDYLALLDQVRAKYPKMVPVLMNGWYAYNVMLAAAGDPHIGGAVWQNGTVKSELDDDNAGWAITTLNDLYLKGYVEKGFATLSKEEAQAVTASGKVFSCLGRFEGLPEARSSLSAENDEKRLTMFYLVKDASVQHIGINGYYIDGDDSVFITSKAKDPVGIVKFFDWCASDEGSLLLNAGVKGVSWDLVDGKRTPTEKAQKAYYEWDSNLLKELGLGAWNGFLPCLAGMDKDGNAYDVCQQAIFEGNKWGQYETVDWKFYSNPNYSVEKVSYIDSEKQKAAYDAQSKINVYIRDRIAKSIAAPSAAASEKEWGVVRDMMKADGIDALNAAFAENWTKAAAFFKKAPADLLKDEAVIGKK